MGVCAGAFASHFIVGLPLARVYISSSNHNTVRFVSFRFVETSSLQTMATVVCVVLLCHIGVLFAGHHGADLFPGVINTLDANAVHNSLAGPHGRSWRGSDQASRVSRCLMWNVPLPEAAPALVKAANAWSACR